ncbi:MAG: hypothetical protein ACREA0_28280, partial [bacterium]
GFGELAQTWSVPVVAKINTGADRYVLVFGGGYSGDDAGDNVPDLDKVPPSFGKDAANRPPKDVPGTDDDEGNAIYVVDAETGELIWKATGGGTGFDSGAKAYRHPDMVDSIPSELAAVDTNGNGLIDRIYFGDTGGVVWRADATGKSGSPPSVAAELGTEISQWTVTPLLDAGRHFDSNADRRFFNRPDVVLSRDSTGGFDAVLIGSGDREHPLGTSVQNSFYMIKDRFTLSGVPPSTTTTPDNLADLTSDCVSNASCDATTQANLANGWFFHLQGSGEKNLASALTLGGKVFFTSFSPSPPAGGVCGLSEGMGKLYAVALQDARGLYNYDTSDDGNERSDNLESGGIPVEVIPIGEDKLLIQGQRAGEGEGGNIQ